MPLPRDYSQGTEFTDLRGNTIKPGDTVVYAALSGRSCQLCEATVLDVAVKEREVAHQDGYWKWDQSVYTSTWDDPNREYIVTNRWTETVYDYKLQLQPTGRYGRWEQHHEERVWDSILRKYEPTGRGIKPVWVMAEQAALVS